MANFKTRKKDKEWFAERCGELLVKVFTGNISLVIDEALERHELQNTSKNRQTLNKAYRTANPNNHQFSKKTYQPFYERGEAKNGTQKDIIFGYTAIDREQRLKSVRDAIAKIFTDTENSVLKEIIGQIVTQNENAKIQVKIDIGKFIEIFKFGENNDTKTPDSRDTSVGAKGDGEQDAAATDTASRRLIERLEKLSRDTENNN